MILGPHAWESPMGCQRVPARWQKLPPSYPVPHSGAYTMWTLPQNDRKYNLSINCGWATNFRWNLENGYSFLKRIQAFVEKRVPILRTRRSNLYVGSLLSGRGSSTWRSGSEGTAWYSTHVCICNVRNCLTFQGRCGDEANQRSQSRLEHWEGHQLPHQSVTSNYPPESIR